MNAADLKLGMIVRGRMLPEAVEALVVPPLGDVVTFVGAGQKARQVHQRVKPALAQGLTPWFPDIVAAGGECIQAIGPYAQCAPTLRPFAYGGSGWNMRGERSS